MTSDTIGGRLIGSDAHAAEVARGERFEFGRNWTRFLSVLDENRIQAAERAMLGMLRAERLDGLRFVDIGSGSGLSSLAARRRGARVHSFDYDPSSVACTAELRRRYFPDDADWRVERGSALDGNYLASLGEFDIVYSWGVLHHTGRMWEALDLASKLVAPGGKCFVALYNDTGTQSRRWLRIKRTYNRLPRVARAPFAMAVTLPQEIKTLARATLAGSPAGYVRTWTGYGERRGMSKWHDILDWVGGYPYEFATPDEVFEFYRDRGFTLFNLNCGRIGLGCNQFVFCRASGATD
ncbi:MAG TPA: class I SAM-dependent methyltransferase [Vicinamibacterales bacterium]|nr:class I SAM-dependent methyltransferase [Vicinamibacterales bacterium]